MKLLIIEDDKVLLDELIHRFNEWDIESQGINDFSDVMTDFIDVKPNLVIIDITLPKYDGFYWCRMIRNISSVPIIFLSSRDHPQDMVMSMQMGADDYVQKPFNFEVLNAKVQALLRRTYEYKSRDFDVFKYRDAVFDFKKLIITRGDDEVELTKNESFILSVLSQKMNEVVLRNEIIEALWDDSRFISDNTLTVNVNRLRKKLELIGLNNAVETKTGSGYILKG
ncbi:response regulator transcription factor [Jeotgalicoccus meleagridis]|jgi:OmpR family two-component system bacitracin resistance response regulator BceR|uniref:Response regulator protein GraR n=1 Tax=Jeotgalicoccus meleagridis TaxID=2759181 RepID=A0A6V7RFD7_9STAP|nr:response regulator transcription factor [Jeotgalicoccus meleagridis]CAD2076649.1 Response regulator protein GraR [Jeotgalicoccus meleagridis]